MMGEVQTSVNEMSLRKNVCSKNFAKVYESVQQC